MPADAREFGKGTILLAAMFSFLIGANWSKIKDFVRRKVVPRKK